MAGWSFALAIVAHCAWESVALEIKARGSDVYPSHQRADRRCICDYTVDGRLRSRRRDNCRCDSEELHEKSMPQSGPMAYETIPQSPPAFFQPGPAPNAFVQSSPAVMGSPPSIVEEDLGLRAKRFQDPPIQFVDSAPTIQSVGMGMHSTRGEPLVVTGGYEIGTPWIDPNAGLWLPVSWVEGTPTSSSEVSKMSFLGRGRKKNDAVRVQRHWVKAPFMVNSPKYDSVKKLVFTSFFPQLESFTPTGKGWN